MINVLGLVNDIQLIINLISLAVTIFIVVLFASIPIRMFNVKKNSSQIFVIIASLFVGFVSFNLMGGVIGSLTPIFVNPIGSVISIVVVGIFSFISTFIIAFVVNVLESGNMKKNRMTKTREEIFVHQKQRKAKIQKKTERIRSKIRNGSDNPLLWLELARSLKPLEIYSCWSLSEKNSAFEAESAYQKAIKAKPFGAETHIELGELYLALEWQSRLERTWPVSSTILDKAKLGNAIIKAKTEFMKALNNEKNRFESNKGLALVYLKLNDYYQAKKHLNCALELKKTDIFLDYILGKTLLKLGENTEATKMFKKIFPNYNSSEDIINKKNITKYGTFNSVRISFGNVIKTNKKYDAFIEKGCKTLNEFDWIDPLFPF